MIDYHTHATRDGVAGGRVDDYLARASALRIREIGLADPLSLWSSEDFTRWYDELRTARDKANNVTLRIGVEVEYVPGKEDEILRLTAPFEFDYVIATIRLGGSSTRDVREYFEAMRRGARERAFDVVSQFDKPQQKGMRVPDDMNHLVTDTLDVLRDSGVAVEVSTADIGSSGVLHPSAEILSEIRRRHIPIVLASGAQSAAQVGAGFGRAVAELKNLGFHHVASFAQRKARPMFLA